MSSYAIFLICAGIGALSGILYDFLYIVRSLFCGMPAVELTVKDKVITAVCDVIYFAALAALYVFCAVLLNIPDIRLYMLAAVLFGIILYIKSFHKVLAFLIKKIYNRFVKR